MNDNNNNSAYNYVSFAYRVMSRKYKTLYDKNKLSQMLTINYLSQHSQTGGRTQSF
jgi:hypothetical protein